MAFGARGWGGGEALGAVTWFSPWVARQADDLHVLRSAGKRISSRCERNRAAVVKRQRAMGENHIVIEKLKKRGLVLAGHLPWLCLQLPSGGRLLLAQGFYRHREPLLSSGVTSPGVGHVLHQAGGLVETTRLRREECKNIWSGEKEMARNRGYGEAGAGAFCERKREGVFRPSAPTELFL